MANTYNRTEVEDLLRALERNATAVIDAARASATEAQQDKFTGYANFKERCDDFDTLSILIEYRLKNMRGGREQDLEEKFDELTVYMVSATLTTSLHFLRILSEREMLPMGSKDLFLRELRSLHHAKEKMQSEKYSAKLNERTLADIKVGEEILAVIIDRAPSLLNLDRKQQ